MEIVVDKNYFYEDDEITTYGTVLGYSPPQPWISFKGCRITLPDGGLRFIIFQDKENEDEL